jgi:hypothetical protein
MKRKNPAHAGRSEYRSREVREIRDSGPYYTVKNEWLTQPPTLTEGHFDLPEVREATVVAEHGREHGASLGRGNFGLTYLTQTVHGPAVVKVAATEALYGNRQRWSRADQQNNMMHEAGVANELADRGYDVVPRTIYVELADGTPALVREYGDLADTLTPDEFYALETRLLALEQETGWRVQDDLLVLRRPDGSLFIGDVGIWQPPTVRNGKISAYDPRDSSLGGLLSKLAESVFGKRVSSLPRIAHLLEGLSNLEEDSFFVKVLREQMQEALASREAVGIPSPPGALALAEAVRENPRPHKETRSMEQVFADAMRRFYRAGEASDYLVDETYTQFHDTFGYLEKWFDKARPTKWSVVQAAQFSVEALEEILEGSELRPGPDGRWRPLEDFARDQDEADEADEEEERDNPAVVDAPGSPIAELSKKLDHRFLWSTRKASELVKGNVIRFFVDRGAEPTAWKVITHPKHDLLNYEPVAMCQIKSLHDGTIRKREYWFSSEEVYVDV